MRMILIAALAVFTFAGWGAAATIEKRKYGNWEYSYTSSGKFRSCNASRVYSNAIFRVRLQGERMEVLFLRDDFRFRWDERLGRAKIRIRGKSYTLSANSPRRGRSEARRSKAVFLNPRSGDVRKLFNDMRRANNLKVVLWNGKSYPVDLKGSSRALKAALTCWERRRTGS